MTPAAEPNQGTIPATDVRLFMPVPVATLSAESCAQFNLYRRTATEFVLFRERQSLVTSHDLEQLRDQNVQYLYVAAAERSKCQEYLHDSLDACLADDDVPVSRRFQLLNDTAMAALRDAFAGGDSGVTASEFENLGHMMVGFLTEKTFVARELFFVLRHDYQTFNHCVNVATYCVLIGQRMGVRDPQELGSIATGALLHDVGMLAVPQRILGKRSTLSMQERSIVERHPQVGFDKLSTLEELSQGQLMMVYQHHERMDGTGYPMRTAGADIHPWARICAVADVFAALTSERPHRHGVAVEKVLEHLNEQAGSSFDEEVVGCLQAALDRKP